jgi:hypothetical protein
MSRTTLTSEIWDSIQDAETKILLTTPHTDVLSQCLSGFLLILTHHLSIDEQYIKTPFYGIAKMTAWLRRQGHRVNHKRVRRLMRQMGLEAVYPRRKRSLSIPDKQHRIYPYLLMAFLDRMMQRCKSAVILYIDIDALAQKCLDLIDM